MQARHLAPAPTPALTLTLTLTLNLLVHGMLASPPVTWLSPLQASKPGAPTDALVITLRGLGFVYASMGQLDRAEAAYSKARTCHVT